MTNRLTTKQERFSGADLDFNSFQDYVDQNWETFKFMALGGNLAVGAGPAVRLPGDIIALRRGRKAEAARAMARNQAAESLVKEVSAAARNSEAMRAAPEAAGAIIEKIARDKDGPQSVFIEAEVLETYRQSAFENDGLDWPDFEDYFLEPLGLTVEQYRGALDEGTSLELRLAGIPAVIENPVWQAIERSEGVIRAEPVNVTDEKIELAGTFEDPFADVELPPEMTEGTKRQVAAQLMAAGMNADKARVQADILTRFLAKPLLAMGVKDFGQWFQDRLKIVKERAGKAEGEGGRTLHQPPLTPEQVRAADEALARDAAAWGKSVDGFLAGTISHRHQPVMLNQTPLVLQMLGAKNLPVVASCGTLKKILVEKHQLPVDVVKRVPKAMADPVMVFKSATQGGDLVMMLGLKDQHGATIVVPLALESRGKAGYAVNSVKSIYPKNHQEAGRPNNQWFVNQINDGNLVYHNNKKSREWSQSSGLQLPGVGALHHGKIRIANEADLVNLREGNPGMYQSAYSQRNNLDTPRGMLAALADGTFRMTLFEGQADASTPIHEGAHLYVELMREVLATAPEHIADWAAFEEAHNDFRKLAEWAGQDDVYGQWSTEAHEKLARGFEAYLMEGRPPVEGLRKVFQKMKDWLMHIYKSVRDLDAALTDEVREVFDRLLATDMELALDRVRLDEPEGLAPEISSALAPARDAARVAHEEAVRTKRLAEVKKMKSQWRKEAGPEADNHPAHRMMDDIVARGGISAESLRNGGYNDPRYTRGLNRKRPGLVSEKGKLGFDEFAHEFQMDSDEFVMALLDAPSKKQLVEEYLARQEAEWADYLAEDAVITDEEIKLRVLELEAIRHQDNVKRAEKAIRDTRKALDRPGGVGRYKSAILRKAGLKPISEADRLNMRDLKISLQNEARGAREGFKKGAAETREKARIKAADAREKSRAEMAAKVLEMTVQFQVKQQIRAEMMKFENLARKLVSQKPGKYYETRGLDPEYHEQLKQLLGQFGIGPGGRDGTPALAAFIAEARNRNEAVQVAGWIEQGQWPAWGNGQRAGHVNRHLIMTQERH